MRDCTGYTTRSGEGTSPWIVSVSSRTNCRYVEYIYPLAPDARTMTFDQLPVVLSTTTSVPGRYLERIFVCVDGPWRKCRFAPVLVRTL